MKCDKCHEEGLHQSFSEVDGSYVIQATCIICGSGWCAGKVTLEEGRAMIAEKEKRERQEARKREEKEPKPKKKDE